MACRNPQARDRARQLRHEGWPLRRIAHETGAALSTVSLWVHDIHPPIAQQGAPTATASAETQVVSDYRWCSRCLQRLPITSFNRHPNGHQWWCRDCYRAYFVSRGQLHRDQTRSARKRRREEARRYVDDFLLSHPCSDCGVADVRILEFDHLHAKRSNIADMIGVGPSLRRLEQELGNCEVVCVNCHRIRTATRDGCWRLDAASLDRDVRLTPGERRNMKYLSELLMQSACVDCGEATLVVLDFDHVGPKRGNVTELARRGVSLQSLQDEISNCVIRCANCHRRRTYIEREECPRQDSNLQPSP